MQQQSEVTHTHTKATQNHTKAHKITQNHTQQKKNTHKTDTHKKHNKNIIPKNNSPKKRNYANRLRFSSRSFYCSSNSSSSSSSSSSSQRPKWRRSTRPCRWGRHLSPLTTSFHLCLFSLNHATTPPRTTHHTPPILSLFNNLFSFFIQTYTHGTRHTGR